MADAIIYKEFDPTDIVAGKAKVKYFPAWSDVTSDSDTTQQAVLSTFYINPAQVTGSIEGFYYWNIYEQNPSVILDAPVQFSVAYGHTGSIVAGVPAGVNTANLTPKYQGGVINYNLPTEYQQIYPAWSIYRQIVNATTNGNAYNNLTFVSGTTTYTMANIYVVAFARTRIKDYVDPNTWQLNLSGSKLVNLVALTASSANQTAFDVVTGVASGYAGTIGNYPVTGSTIGRFYSDKGIIVLDADMLYAYGATTMSVAQALRIGPGDTNGVLTSGPNQYSSSLILSNFLSSIVGVHQSTTSDYVTSSGILYSGSTDSYFKARSVERVQSTHYFVRAKNTEFNNSTNPTWVSGSSNEVLSVFFDDPKTFITSIGLYDGTTGQVGSGQLVAIAKTSKPLPKDSTTEALVKVRLDF